MIDLASCGNISGQLQRQVLALSSAKESASSAVKSTYLDRQTYAMLPPITFTSISISNTTVSSYPNISADNPVFELFNVEQQTGDEERVKKALQIVDDIISRAKRFFNEASKKGVPLSPQDQLEKVYRIIRTDMQIESSAVGVHYLYEGLSRKAPATDCRTGCLLFIVLGHEFSWTLSNMNFLPKEEDVAGHQFLKWNDVAEGVFFFETTNGDVFKKVSDYVQYSKYQNSQYQGLVEVTKEQLIGNSCVIAAEGHFNKKEFHDTVRLYSAAIEKKPVNLSMSSIYYNRGMANGKIGNNEAALADYTRAIEFDPSHEFAYYRRALIYAKSKVYDKALADTEVLLKFSPNNEEYLELRNNIFYNRAVDNYKAYEYDRALADAEILLKFSPNNEEYLNLRDIINRKKQQ
jgi:hypothetical protein